MAAPEAKGQTTSQSALAKLNTYLAVPLSAPTVVPSLLAGASARISGAILTSPLDSLKARVQFSQKSSEVYQHKSTLETAKHMYQKEGIGSFYRGLPARLVYVGPAAAVSFLFYEQFRSMFHRPKDSVSSYALALGPLTAAGLMRVVGTTIRTPFDVVRQRMQVMGGLKAYDKGSIDAKIKEHKKLPHGIYRNTFHAMYSVARSEGISSLFAGVYATILRDVPFSIAYFLSYESIRTIQQTLMGGSETNDKLHSGNHMISGALAAAVAVTISNPLDVMKTRLQTQGALTHKRYQSVISCFNTIYKEEGLKGFTRGLGPRIMYLSPSAAITFTLYEAFKKVFGKIYHIDPALLTKSAVAIPTKVNGTEAG